MTKSNDISRIFLDGCDLKDRAIASLDNLDLYIEAANKFQQGCDLARRYAIQITDKEEAAFLECLSAYYESEKHYCLSAYEYEKRNTVTARNHAESGLLALNLAIQRCRSDVFTGERRRILDEHVITWTYYQLSRKADMHAIEARSHWDGKRYVQALDCYNAAITAQQNATKFAADNGLDQRYIRISSGNVIGMSANASQALAMHMWTQGDVDPSQESNILSNDIAFRFIRFALDAYQNGNAAYQENPEWAQYREAAEQCRLNVVEFLKENRQKWFPLYIEFEDDIRLHKLMKNVDLIKYKEIVQMVEIPRNKSVKLWAIGSFWLFALSIIVGLILLIMNHGAGFLTTLLIIVGIEVILALIGALTLRSTGDLSEEGFIKLMTISLKTQFRIAKLFKDSGNPTSDKGNSA